MRNERTEIVEKLLRYRALQLGSLDGATRSELNQMVKELQERLMQLEAGMHDFAARARP